MNDIKKINEQLYVEGLNDFLKKFPELNNYDLWIRAAQTMIYFSDIPEQGKQISSFLANSIVRALDEKCE